jgi:putative FmdB family regulatory protein
MPIYEYRCEACGRQHEALQRISDKPLRACPSCGKRMLKRLMSAPRFRLKGEGWYETDFKSDKDKKRNLADSGGEGAPGSAGESAGDSTGSSAGEKSGDKKVDKSESGDKAGKPLAAKADGKGNQKPSTARDRSVTRKAVATRRRSRARRA